MMNKYNLVCGGSKLKFKRRPQPYENIYNALKL